MTGPFIKDPDDVLDYKWDWSGWLADNEVIQTALIFADSGITVDSDSHDDTTVTVWLSGGTAGKSYEVTNRIITNQLRTVDRTAGFRIRNR